MPFLLLAIPFLVFALAAGSAKAAAEEEQRQAKEDYYAMLYRVRR